VLVHNANMRILPPVVFSLICSGSCKGCCCTCAHIFFCCGGGGCFVVAPPEPFAPVFSPLNQDPCLFFPDAQESPYASSKFAKEEQYQQSYDTASNIETPTSSRASLDAAKLFRKEGWTLLPPRDMRGISCAPKQKEKIRVQLNNQREFFPDSVDPKAFDLLKATGKLQSETDFRDLARLAHQLRKGTQSPMKELPCSPSVSSRDMHQPSSIWEMGQFSANSSHAAILSQGSKELIRTTDFKDSISQHSSEKSWKDLSQSSVEASQGNPADIRELATFAQAWRSEPKSTVQHHPYHGIRKDPHWTARSIVKELGTYSSKTRHVISQAQDFQEAMRSIDFMDSQKVASEKVWRDVSLNSVDRSPSHSTADIRAFARLEWQRRKEPQLSVKEDLCDSVTRLDPHGSSSVKKTGQYSVESNHATTKPQNLNQTMRATCFGDSQIWRDASQNSLDTRDQHSLSSVTSQLSVDNRMYQSSTPQPSFDSRDQSQTRSIHSPRASTGNSSLEAIPEVRSGSLKSNFSVESRRQEQSVVARLMGLELLPPDSDIVPPSAGTSSRMGKSLHNLVISTPQAEQAAPASDQARLHKHLSEAAQYLKEVSQRSHQITLPKAIVMVKSKPRLKPRSRSSSPAPGQYEEDLHRIGSQQLPQKASNF